MEDLDLSSCSFVSEEAESVVSHPSQALNTQNLELENQRLHQINDQLQTSIAALRGQLKDALDTISSNQGSNENTQAYKAQILESTTKIDKLTAELKEITSQKESLELQYQKATVLLKTQANEFNTKIQALNEQINKLKKERNTYRADIQQKEQLLDVMTTTIKKQKVQRKKQSQTFDQISEKMEALIAENGKYKNDLDIALEEQALHINEIQSLKTQLSTLMQNHEAYEAAIESSKRESIVYSSSLAILESQLESQRQELEEISNERQKCLSFASNLQKALAKAEEKLEKVIIERDSLAEKLAQSTTKSHNKIAQLFAQNDVIELELPFEGDIKDECENILKLPQYTPYQKVQLIINVCAKHIEESEREIRKITSENLSMSTVFAESQHSSKQYANILNALLAEFKDLLSNEEQMGKLDINKDQEFINFVANKASEIDPDLREAVMNDPGFISDDFFTTADLEKRRENIETMIDRNDATYPLFISQFLVNIMLRSQIDTLILKYKDSLPKNDDKVKTIAAIASGSNNEITELRNRVERLTTSRKQILEHLKSAKREMLEMNKADNEMKTKLAQLEIQNESYRNECEVMKMKLKLANNELIARSSEMSSMSSLMQPLKEGDSKSSKITRLQEELGKKNQEVTELNNRIVSLQNEISKEKAAYQRQIRKAEENCRNEVQHLIAEMEEIDSKKKVRARAQKKKEREIEIKHNKEIQQLSAQLEETKQSMNASIISLTEKTKAANELSCRLNEQVKESEAKATAFADQNSQLIAAQKSLQLEINTLKQQMSKERQHIQGQLSAQMMAYETKIQQVQQEARINSLRQVREMISTMQENIGVLYGLEEGDLSEETFKQLVVLVKQDIEKLKYFQAKTTKYQHSVEE